MDVILNVRIDAELAAKLDDLSRRTERTRSDVVRRLLAVASGDMERAVSLAEGPAGGAMIRLLARLVDAERKEEVDAAVKAIQQYAKAHKGGGKRSGVVIA